MKTPSFFPSLAFLCLGGFGIITLQAADPPEESISSVLSLHPQDEHSIKAEGDTVTIDIRSERGIGRTTIKSADGKWPKRVVLHLHLRGLEHFEISNGSHALATSVGSTKDAVPRPTHLTEGDGAARLEIENQIGPDHALFLHVRPVVSDGKKPAIPLDGYFEIEIPKELFKANPRELRLRWIDFYR